MIERGQKFDEWGISDGKTKIVVHGIDYGSAPLILLQKSENAMIVHQGGHNTYLNRMSGSQYFSPRFIVFKLVSPTEVLDYIHPSEFEYKRGGKHPAEAQAFECFKELSTGEWKKGMTFVVKEEPPKPFPKDIGAELWRAIESPEGFAFISDAVLTMEPQEVYKIAKASLEQHNECVRILRNFLFKYKGCDGAK